MQRRLDHAEIEDHLVGIGVSRAGPADILPLDLGDGGVEPPQHDGEELTVGLAGIARFDLLRLAGRGQRALQLGPETGGRGKRALGDGQCPGQPDDALAIVPQRGERVLPQGPGGDLGGDPWIAVAVAADPGAELKKGRQLEALPRIVSLERRFGQRQHLRRLLEQSLVEEVKPAADLVLHGGLFQMQFAGHPHQLDLVAQIVDQRGTLPLGPARHLQLAQGEIDAAVLLQHGDALRLGRMGGDHRPDAQAGKQRLDLLRGNVVLRRFGQHMGEGAAQGVAPAGPFDLAAAAHGGVLLGDGEKLKPNALRLEGAGHRLGRKLRDIGVAPEHRLDLGLMPPHHLDQQPEQEIGRFLSGGAADHGLGRPGIPGWRFGLLVHGDATHSQPLRPARDGFSLAPGRRPTAIP